VGTLAKVIFGLLVKTFINLFLIDLSNQFLQKKKI
jgi:hypothetical protein